MVNNYFQKHEKRLRKEARERYQNLSEEGKHEIRKKVRKRYQNFTEEEKEKRYQYFLESKKKLPVYRRDNYSTLGNY